MMIQHTVVFRLKPGADADDFLTRARGLAAIAGVNAGNSLLIYSNYRKSDRVETVATVESPIIGYSAHDGASR